MSSNNCRLGQSYIRGRVGEGGSIVLPATNDEEISSHRWAVERGAADHRADAISHEIKWMGHGDWARKCRYGSPAESTPPPPPPTASKPEPMPMNTHRLCLRATT